MFDRNHLQLVAKVTFTKTFVLGSILEGLSLEETIEFGSLESTENYIQFLNKHTEKAVKACAGSNYTTSNIKVEYA